MNWFTGSILKNWSLFSVYLIFFIKDSGPAKSIRISVSNGLLMPRVTFNVFLISCQSRENTVLIPCFLSRILLTLVSSLVPRLTTNSRSELLSRRWILISHTRGASSSHVCFYLWSTLAPTVFCKKIFSVYSFRVIYL